MLDDPTHVECALPGRVEEKVGRDAIDGDGERLDDRRRPIVAGQGERETIVSAGSRVERLLDASDAKLSDEIDGMMPAAREPATWRRTFPIDRAYGYGPACDDITAGREVEDVARIGHAPL